MSMTTKLNVEIEDKLDELTNMDPSTKEYAVAVDSVTKLMDRAIEIEKLETEKINKEMDREVDFHIKNIQIKE